MTTFTLRQIRTQLVGAIVAIVAVAVALLVVGRPHLVHLSDATGISACRARGDCPTLTHEHIVQYLSTVLVAIPALVGLFWGAPLIAHELETGTHRLAWTQSVTRTRWVATKLAVVGVASMILTGAFSLLLTWWAGPYDHVNGDRFSPTVFSQRGVAPLGYAALAFAMGALAGTLIRRTIPAMAATLAAFIGAREVITYQIRPHFASAVTSVQALRATVTGDFSHTSTNPSDWIVSRKIIDAAGHATQTIRCPALAQSNSRSRSKSVLDSCFSAYHQVLAVQPGGRFWRFQWLELGFCVAVALVLCGSCFWWVRRRLS